MHSGEKKIAPRRNIKESQREQERKCIHVSDHSYVRGEDEKKFVVKIHLPSMRAVGEGTYCTLHINALCRG